MRKKILTLTFAAMSLCYAASAQEISKDSLNSLHQQKDVIAVSKKLNDRKIELVKLENELAQKTREVEKTTKAAQESADDNQKIAGQLTGDPQDRKLAKRAGKAARNAQSDAKSARKASDALERLKKNIESLRSKIADDESKLVSLPGYRAPK